jgi:hypothetical protein
VGIVYWVGVALDERVAVGVDSRSTTTGANALLTGVGVSVPGGGTVGGGGTVLVGSPFTVSGFDAKSTIGA